jgi:hypothetical protein
MYSDHSKNDKKHVRAVMTSFEEAVLKMKTAQCEFHEKEVKYLGLIDGVNGIGIDVVSL